MIDWRKPRGMFDAGKPEIRYSLWWTIDPAPLFVRHEGAVAWCMLNPSTATDLKLDPTLRKCAGFTQRWGYNRFVVVNLWAVRSTDPRGLKPLPEPHPTDGVNFTAIVEAAVECEFMVCGWGNHGTLRGRSEHVMRRLRDGGFDLRCLLKTREGEPGHPLYIPYDTPLVSL